MYTNYNNISNRSEKVRALLLKMPSLLFNIGIVFNLTIVFFIFVFVYFIPYNEYRIVDIQLFDKKRFKLIKMPIDGYFWTKSSSSYIDVGENIGFYQNPNGKVSTIISKSSGEMIFNYPNNSFLNKDEIVCAIITNDSIVSISGIGCVDRKTMCKINHGQNIVCELSSDFEDVKYELVGRVVKIYPEPETLNDELMYRIEINFINFPFKSILLFKWKCKARVLISNESILYKVIKSYMYNHTFF